MRIRQVKPAFWTDAKVAALPPAVRLFYIGLWMEADDAGWLRWDLSQIANELYGYESRKKREREVSAYVDLLVKAERVVIHHCGHAFIPRLTDHQHLSATTKQVKTYLREHAECEGSPPTPAEAREYPPLPGRKGIGKERVSNSGHGQVSKGNGQVSAPAKAPDGAGATITDEDLPTFLRVVQS